MPMDRPAGFFAALFDMSFSSFITTKIIKVLYIITIVGAGLLALFGLIGGLTQGAGPAILALILAPSPFSSMSSGPVFGWN